MANKGHGGSKVRGTSRSRQVTVPTQGLGSAGVPRRCSSPALARPLRLAAVGLGAVR